MPLMPEDDRNTFRNTDQNGQCERRGRPWLCVALTVSAGSEAVARGRGSAGALRAIRAVVAAKASTEHKQRLRHENDHGIESMQACVVRLTPESTLSSPPRRSPDCCRCSCGQRETTSQQLQQWRTGGTRSMEAPVAVRRAHAVARARLRVIAELVALQPRKHRDTGTRAE